MSEARALPGRFLDDAGLNRQHVFNLSDLPDDLLAPLEVQAGETQLILIGHAGRRLWDRLQADGMSGSDPIDDYTRETVHRWITRELPERHYRIVYPGERMIGLQALGKLAGWHYPSPIMVGVDAEWGSWYAYRAVVVADTDFIPTPRQASRTPCLDCTAQPCIAACPAGALRDGQFNLPACSRHRLQPDSPCALGCLARQACPVGRQHRYDDAQIHHSYARSLAVIRQFYPPATDAPEQP